VLLDPGATQKTRTPSRNSSPINNSAHATLALGASAKGVTGFGVVVGEGVSRKDVKDVFVRPSSAFVCDVGKKPSTSFSRVFVFFATSDSRGVVFRLSSRHSATASAAATTPTPAYRRITVPGGRLRIVRGRFSFVVRR